MRIELCVIEHDEPTHIQIVADKIIYLSNKIYVVTCDNNYIKFDKKNIVMFEVHKGEW